MRLTVDFNSLLDTAYMLPITVTLLVVVVLFASTAAAVMYFGRK
jgi:hypothetical protein